MWIAFILFVIITVLCAASEKERLIPYDKHASKQLQGIYAMLIVVGHICNYMDSSNITPPVLQSLTMNLREFARFVVGGFFFISGYGIAVSGGIATAQKLIKRLIKVTKPFLFFTVIYQLVLTLTNELDISRNIACLSKGNTTYLLPNCWFVFVIMVFYVISYALTQITSKINRCVLVVIFSVIIIACLTKMQFGAHWYISTLAIPAGYIIGSYKDFFQTYVLKNKRLCLLLCCCALPLSFLSISYTFLQLFSISLFSILITIAVQKYRLLKLPITNYCGKISYEVYLSHGIVLYCLKYAGVSNAIGIVLCTYVGAIIMSDIYCRLKILENIKKTLHSIYEG